MRLVKAALALSLLAEPMHVKELFSDGKGLPSPDHTREERRGRERDEVVARALMFRPRSQWFST